MCGSSSTTTTVPLSVLTHLASISRTPNCRNVAHPLQNPHVCRTPASPGALTMTSRAPPEGPDERSTHVECAHHLIRFGAARAWPPRRRLAAAAGGAAAAAAPPAPAAPATAGPTPVPATLAGIKAKAATDITKRVNDLNAAIAKVNAAKGLGSGQATLGAYLGADISPLQQLNAKIQGDTTVQAGRTGLLHHLHRLPRLCARAAGGPDRRRRRPRHHHDASRAHRGRGQGAASHVNPRNQASSCSRSSTI